MANMVGVVIGRRIARNIVAAIRCVLTRRRLQLQRRVEHIEAQGQDLLQRLQQRRGWSALRIVNDVCGEAGLAAGQRPDMKVVNAQHTIDRADGFLNLSNVYAVRHAFQQDVQALFQQHPCSRQHPQTDGHGDH